MKSLKQKFVDRVRMARFKVGNVVEATVIGSPGMRFLFVRPNSDPEIRALVPGTFYPQSWQNSGIPGVSPGDVVKAVVREFDPTQIDNSTGMPKLVLSIRDAMKNPYKGLESMIGKIVEIEVVSAGSAEDGILVKLCDRPDVCAWIRPGDISVKHAEPGWKFRATITDASVNNQTVELSMVDAVRRGKARSSRHAS